MNRTALVAAFVLACAALPRASAQGRPFHFEDSMNAWVETQWPVLRGDLLGADQLRAWEDEARAEAEGSGARLESFEVLPPRLLYAGFGVLDIEVGFVAKVKKKMLFLTARMKFTYRGRLRIRLANPFRSDERHVRESQLVSSSVRIAGSNLLGSIVKIAAGNGIVASFRRGVDAALADGGRAPLFFGAGRGMRHATAPEPFEGVRAHRLLGNGELFLVPPPAAPPVSRRDVELADVGGPDPRRSRFVITFVGDGFASEREFTDLASACLDELAAEKAAYAWVLPHLEAYALYPRGGPDLLGIDYRGEEGGEESWALDGDRLESIVAASRPVREGAQAVVVVLTTRPVRPVAASIFGLAIVGDRRGLLQDGASDEETRDLARVFLHELSHVVGLLDDEYPHAIDRFLPAAWQGVPWLADAVEALSPNLTFVSNGQKWEHLMERSTRVGAIDDGTIILSAANPIPAYRPSPRCLMNDPADPMCPVCREQVSRRLLTHLLLDVGPQPVLEVSQGALDREGWTAGEWTRALELLDARATLRSIVTDSAGRPVTRAAEFQARRRALFRLLDATTLRFESPGHGGVRAIRVSLAGQDLVSQPLSLVRDLGVVYLQDGDRRPRLARSLPSLELIPLDSPLFVPREPSVRERSWAPGSPTPIYAVSERVNASFTRALASGVRALP